MRVAQVKLNQDMSFGKRNVAVRKVPLSSKESRALGRLTANGFKVDEQPHAWQVLKRVGPEWYVKVLEIPGKGQTYSKVAEQVLR